MIELAKHIEVLLLENDCVIVPGLGGFIAHNRQAEFNESENLFSSPARIIGFNPQLVMNDGLLVQTYMQAYNTDFPDATRKIENIVSALKEQLYQKGEVLLPNVGTLYYTMKGTYVFEPSSEKFFTPYLYGLDSLCLSPLQAVATKEEERVTVHTFIHHQKKDVTKEAYTHHMPSYKRTFQRMAQHAVGVAAAIFLFFLLSVPVENTYMDDASYASLGAESMFDAIRGRSVATHLLSADESNQVNPKQQNVHRTKSNVNTLRPVCVKSETVAPAPTKPATKKLSTKVAEMKEATTTQQPEAAKKVPVTSASKNKVVAKANNTENDKAKVEKIANVKVETNSVKAAVKPASSKGYYIIVASLATSADAQKQLNVFKNKGFKGACVVENGNRHRIALYRFSNQADAYKQLKELRAQEDYKNAWVFASK